VKPVAEGAGAYLRSRSECSWDRWRVVGVGRWQAVPAACRPATYRLASDTRSPDNDSMYSLADPLPQVAL
jgi:hypothetical protein